MGERGGFVQRLQEGTWCGHVLEHVIIELLNLAGMPTGFRQDPRAPRERGVYKRGDPCPRRRGRPLAALAQGRALLMAAINDEPFDVDAAVARAARPRSTTTYLGPQHRLHRRGRRHRAGASPTSACNEGNLVQLGYGAAPAPHLDGRDRPDQRHRREASPATRT